jgi:hypothetical protein
MTVDDLPLPAPAKPLWLMTLADLALLLIGFLLLQQALAREDPERLATALRAGFGSDDAAMPVAAAAVDGFAPGSATLPRVPGDVIAWATAALADPRASLAIAGSTDGSRADVDPATRSGTILAADRARALTAALIAAGLPSDRLTITSSSRPRRAATVSVAFVGHPGPRS